VALLRIDGLGHNFGGLRAVDGFDLELGENQVVGLIGPNGAGKTTVFNLVCGLYRPTDGSIVFDGIELAGKRPHQITSLGIGRTFQNIRLWNELTVLDNIRIAHFSQIRYGIADALLGTRRMKEDERQVTREATTLLERFQLEPYAQELAKNLSYGIQRRVELARALVMKPKLLLLDEPAAGMNPADVAVLMDLIRWVRETFYLTIWIIEHQMQVIMGVCEHIKVLDFGKTLAEGAPEQIRNDPKVIEAYLGEEVD
jgi:branched-chain amino acid transport system ATP-binding protein